MLINFYRQIFIKINRLFLLKNTRKFLQQQPIKELIKNSNKSSIYQQPSFYRYFNDFLKENDLNKYVSSELKFKFTKLFNDLIDVDEILKESQDNDDEFTVLSRNEFQSLIEQLLFLQNEILNSACIDDHDINECSFEIRAGVGGREAGIFAQELYDLYIKYILFNGWQIRTNEEEFEQIEIEDNSSLFTRIIEVTGNECYSLLRHEAGVHRVQRVPRTEKYGRVHTSTVSIAVIPVRHNLVQVKESDLKFEVKNSSGAGGQNVNRNLTCVRVTHIPTGHTVESQETRHQYLNKELAIRKISQLLNQIEYERLENEARKQKKDQIGIGARSDKIRTYNFQQNRITDHRLTNDNNLFNIHSYMSGNECDKILNLAKKLEQIRHTEMIKQLRNLYEKNYAKSLLSSSTKIL